MAVESKKKLKKAVKKTEVKATRAKQSKEVVVTKPKEKISAKPKPPAVAKKKNLQVEPVSVKADIPPANKKLVKPPVVVAEPINPVVQQMIQKVAQEEAAKPVASTGKKKVRSALELAEALVRDVSADYGNLEKLMQKWLALQDKLKDQVAAPYKMTASYTPKTPILHKVLGWGYVISAQNDRLEVLFKDGIKYLISNYQKR